MPRVIIRRARVANRAATARSSSSYSGSAARAAQLAAAQRAAQTLRQAQVQQIQQAKQRAYAERQRQFYRNRRLEQERIQRERHIQRARSQILQPRLLGQPLPRLLGQPLRPRLLQPRLLGQPLQPRLLGQPRQPPGIHQEKTAIQTKINQPKEQPKRKEITIRKSERLTRRSQGGELTVKKAFELKRDIPAWLPDGERVKILAGRLKAYGEGRLEAHLKSEGFSEPRQGRQLTVKKAFELKRDIPAWLPDGERVKILAGRLKAYGEGRLKAHLKSEGFSEPPQGRQLTVKKAFELRRDIPACLPDGERVKILAERLKAYVEGRLKAHLKSENFGQPSKPKKQGAHQSSKDIASVAGGATKSKTFLPSFQARSTRSAHKAGTSEGVSSSYRTRQGNRGGGGDGSGSDGEGGGTTAVGYRGGVVTRSQSKKLLEGNTLSTHGKGALAEGMGEAALRRLGCEILPCKLPGNQGFDLVGVLRKEGKIEKIFIVESKYSHKGKFGLPNTVNKGKQMSSVWVRETIRQMLRSRNTEIVKTAKILKENDDKWALKGNVLDNKGLNRWDKPTRKVEQVFSQEKQSSRILKCKR